MGRIEKERIEMQNRGREKGKRDTEKRETERCRDDREVRVNDLTHLRQTGTLADYNAAFDYITAKLDLPEDYLVDTYVSALKPKLEGPVRMFNPRTLTDARRLARMQEIIFEKQGTRLLDRTSGNVSTQPGSHTTAKNEDEAEAVATKRSHVLVSVFREPGTWENTKAVNNVSGSQLLRTKDSGSSIFSEQGLTPCTTLKTNKDGEPGTSWLSLLAMCSVPTVSVSFLLSNSFSSSMSPHDAIAFVLETIWEGVAWPATVLSESAFFYLCLTWKNRVEIEKSNSSQPVCIYLISGTVHSEGLQLDSNSSMWQKYFEGLQLGGTHFRQQNYFNWTMGFLIPDEFMGFKSYSKLQSPISLHLDLVISMGPDLNRLLQAFLLCFPTRLLVQIWFKGRLISMLFGRLCSLRGKKRRKSVHQY